MVFAKTLFRATRGVTARPGTARRGHCPPETPATKISPLHTYKQLRIATHSQRIRIAPQPNRIRFPVSQVNTPANSDITGYMTPGHSNPASVKYWQTGGTGKGSLLIIYMIKWSRVVLGPMRCSERIWMQQSTASGAGYGVVFVVVL